jgi:hypothetical protein
MASSPLQQVPGRGLADARPRPGARSAQGCRQLAVGPDLCRSWYRGTGSSHRPMEYPGTGSWFFKTFKVLKTVLFWI